MSRVLFLSPMVPSFDLAATGRFFSDCLSFHLTYRSDTYAIFERDGLTVHLLPAGPDIGQMEFYIEVDDVDEAWEAMKDKISGLRHRAPFDREYGMREAHVEVPATNTLLFIGQSIHPPHP